MSQIDQKMTKLVVLEFDSPKIFSLGNSELQVPVSQSTSGNIRKYNKISWKQFMILQIYEILSRYLKCTLSTFSFQPFHVKVQVLWLFDMGKYIMVM